MVRAIEYTLKAGSPYNAALFLPIEGASEFRKGRADTIAGLETPDDRTLVLHLRERLGDLAERFAIPLTAPIPAGAEAAEGRLGRVPVASGPYMLAGSADYDFSRPPSTDRLPSGYSTNRHRRSP